MDLFVTIFMHNTVGKRDNFSAIKLFVKKWPLILQTIPGIYIHDLSFETKLNDIAF